MIFEFEKYIDKKIRVKFLGGREVVGVLKGYDKLVNLVLDDCIEYLRDPADPGTITDKTRPLGLLVCKGPNVSAVCPEDGMVEIANPFLEAEEE